MELIDAGICLRFDLKLRAPKHPIIFSKLSDLTLICFSLLYLCLLLWDPLFFPFYLCIPFCLSFLLAFYTTLSTSVSITWTLYHHLTCVFTSGFSHSVPSFPHLI